MIEFFLNGQHQRLDQGDPNQSILDWLRTKMRLTGTKEGCASGDCGACTVVIGVPDPTCAGRLRYDSVNSCIALVGSLHGKHLVTVDALHGEPSHPVQKAMVECHGAQCGFCTPGIVMSLFALHTESALTGTPPDDKALFESLSGNLCRCTGYRPILDAGREALVQTWDAGNGSAALNRGAALSGPAPEDAGTAAPGAGGPTWLQEPETLASLVKIQTQPGELNDVRGLRFDAPTTLEALRSLLAESPKARLLAGGTDLALEITQQLKTLDHVISLDGVKALQGIRHEDTHLYLGAGATYRDLHESLTRDWPAFGPMLERLGSRQIRNRGTLGGNIGNASPIGDMPPPLIALGATLELDSANGQRSLPLEAFFLNYKQTALAPGEFISGVRVPHPAPGERLFIYKVSKRIDDDISAVLAAFWMRFEGEQVAACRLAFGGMAATPSRAPGAEAVLTGKPWNEETIDATMAALAQDFSPLSDVRASASYRRQVAANLLRRAFLESEAQTNQSGDGARAARLTVTDYA